MTLMEWWRRLRFNLRKRRELDDLDEEMRLHREMRAEANLRAGMSAADARRDANRRFGNALQLREDSRDRWGWLSLDRFAQDVRYGWRQIVRYRTSTIAAALTLALGIAANASMFSLVDVALLRAPDAARPDRLAWIATVRGKSRSLRNLSYPDYLACRARHDVFEGVLAFSGARMSVGGESPERVEGELVSGNYFDVLGVKAALGRTFAADEDAAPGAHAVAVLGDDLWRDRYHADRAIINSSIVINGRPFTVIGVAPPGFHGVQMVEDRPQGIWVPMAMVGDIMPGDKDLLSRTGTWLRVVARLRDDVGIARANAAMNVLARQLPHAPADAVGLTVLPVSGGLEPSNRSEVGTVIGLLALVPMFVLVVAVANAANVLLARGVARVREIAMRRALGASRARVIRQLLTEYVGIAVLAGIAGLTIAPLLTRLIGYAGDLPPAILDVLTITPRVAMVSLGLAAAAGLVCGLVPALVTTRPALLPVIKDAVSVRGGRRRRWRDVFLVAEVALSLTLLVTAGLLLRSVSKALDVDPGFTAAGAASVSFDLDMQRYTNERQRAFTAALLDRARAIPGVEAAALTTVVPLSGWSYGSDVVNERLSDKDAVGTQMSVVSPDFFRAIGTPLRQGRDFSVADAAGAAPVVIVNEALAARLWPGEEAVGHRLKVGIRGEPWREVIGVAGSAKYDALTDPASDMVFLPLAERPQGSLALVLRTRADASMLPEAASRLIRGLDPDLPVFSAAPLTAVLLRDVGRQRAASAMLAVCGLLALVLSVLGVYGVTSHGAAIRLREIGIRTALGARPIDVTSMLIVEGAPRLAVGIAAGLGASLALSRVLASFLFGLTATDAATFASAAGIIGSVSLAAALVPARRAARVDPVKVLRAD